MSIPNGAQYYYKHTYYRLGSNKYALYFGKLWSESASVTNQELITNGTRIYVKSLLNQTNERNV